MIPTPAAIDSPRENSAQLGEQGEFVDTRWWSFDEVVHGPRTRSDPLLPRFVDKLVGAIA